MEDIEQCFWDMRSQDARDKIFADAGLLWENARAYFKYCTENPIRPGKDKGERFSSRVQSITLPGLCLYLGCTPDWYQDFKTELDNKDDELTDRDVALQEVIDRIEQVIYLHKYNYAAAGLLNARVVIRDLDLNEKKQNDNRKQVWDVRVEGEDE